VFLSKREKDNGGMSLRGKRDMIVKRVQRVKLYIFGPM
jgi:hypothetical protein